MDWTVESWGAGSQTRSFFVPAGISATLPTYSTENVRLSEGLRKALSTSCWAGAWQQASAVLPAQQESPLAVAPEDSQPIEPATRASRAAADTKLFIGTTLFQQ